MDKKRELPLGTTETYANMHKWLRRALWVCLTALVIEGTLTFPLAMIWMGWPTLTLREVCDEMGKTRWSDDDYVCIYPYPLWEKSEAQGQKTAKDKWGVQPTPGYRRIGYRDLVKWRDERRARQAAANQGAEHSALTKAK
jgi:hypothetical protein